MTEEQARKLIDESSKRALTEPEEASLIQWLDDRANQAEFRLNENQKSFLHALLTRKLQASTGINLSGQHVSEKYSGVPRYSIWKWAAAASVLLIMGLSAYLFLRRDAAKPMANNIADIAMPASRATLTLANGEKILIDSAGHGVLTSEHNANILKTAQGNILYKPTGNSNEIVYNTLSVPKGSQIINLTLSDGSSVWLNAGSSIRFPVAFKENERNVEITGEAYFEIAKKAESPFKIIRPDKTTLVEVLGTDFNVNTYEDEAATEITLLQGSVKVINNNNSKLIKPGEQAQLFAAGNRIELNKEVNIEKVMAWKNGLFYLTNTSLDALMKQVSRWYDVEVEYHGNFEKSVFTGVVSRKQNLDRLLKILSSTGDLYFEIKGKKLLVYKR